MISIIQEKFASAIADKITRFLEHPTAHMIKELKRYTDLLTFDTHNDWHKWQSVERMTKLAGTNRGYMTYNTGGQKGGVARLPDRDIGQGRIGTAWYVWNLGRNIYIYAQRIPAELVLVERSEDGYQAIKLVLEGTYELKDGEDYLDDFEDMALENEAAEESERGLMNDDEEENDDYDDYEGRPDESEAEAENEMEDEAEDYEALVNNEMRAEVAALVEQIRDYSARMENESSVDGFMTLNMLINQANERCRELRTQLAARRQDEGNERREEIEQLNQKRRQEIASLTRELADNYELTDQQSTFNGVMAVNYVIHASQLRIAELKNEIARSGQ